LHNHAATPFDDSHLANFKDVSEIEEPPRPFLAFQADFERENEIDDTRYGGGRTRKVPDRGPYTTGFEPIRAPKSTFSSRIISVEKKKKPSANECVTPAEVNLLSAKFPQCRRDFPPDCGQSKGDPQSGFAALGHCLVDTVPAVSTLSVVPGADAAEPPYSNDEECTWLVRNIFPRCDDLITSCQALRSNDRAVPVLGCLFSRYGGTMDALLKVAKGNGDARAL